MMDDDTAAMFDLADFATPARLGSGAIVNGIFDADVRQILGVDTEGPAFTCPASSPVVAGDVLTITVRGEDTSYRVVARVSGDEDVATWQLHKL